MPKKPLRIGLVGYGFMGRTHVAAYRAAREVSRRKGLWVVAAVFGGLLMLTALATAAIGFR